MSDSKLRRFAEVLFVDVSPLRRSREYRWLYAGLANAWLGRQLTVVAVPFQVYDLTGSTLAVGLLGAVQFVPLLATSVVGGAVADAVDRRRLLVVSQVALAGTAAGLMWNALLETPLLWPLYVLAGLNAAISAVDSPTRAAVVPTLVGRDLLSSALALNQTLGNVAKAVGPALGGLLIATAGLEWTFGLEVALFIGGALAMFRIRPLPPVGGGRRVGLASIVEGLTFLKRRRLLQANFAIDLSATIFGMPRALFPAIGTQILGGDAVVVGLLYAAPGVGALLGAITSGWIPRVERQGRAVIVAVTVWGAAMAMFGMTSSVLPAVVFLGVAGFADVVSAVFRNTILQLSIPDALRGRLSGIHIAVVSGGPRLGDLEAGAVAALTSVRFSVVSGGLACIAGALAIGRYMPEFVRYRHGDPIAQPTPKSP
jgi:MFS family permease